MKILKKISFFSFILLPVAFILNIYFQIPSKIVITENSNYSIKLSEFCSIKNEKTKLVSSSEKSFFKNSENEVKLNTSTCGNYSLPVKIFNKIPLKTIAITVAPQNYLIPSGDTIGIKLYTDGLLVVGLSDFITSDGAHSAPALEAGLKVGDRIVAINSVPITTIEDFSSKIENLTSSIFLTVIRGNEELQLSVNPKISKDDNQLKLGTWVRDSTAGIGTLTYYNPQTSEFAALGHAICDADTDEIMTVRRGNIMTCDILSVTKGISGTPGEIVGGFSNIDIGKISKNSQFGIFGEIKDSKIIELQEALPVATRYEIKEGVAEILSDVDGCGVKKYQIEITKISKSASTDNKGIVLKVTDQSLLEKTGGIIQGMSGSPIIQDGKLVGAVTHVFVNDPTRGYGIFIENMLAEAEKIK